MTKIAVVTGAGSGIGRAVAVRLAADAFLPCLLGRRAERLDLADGIAFPADVTDRPGIEGVVAKIGERFGRIDALINVAGIIRTGPLASMSQADIADQIEINLRGTITVTQAALPLLAAARGTVINLSSVRVARPSPNAAVYIATKGALEAFSRALAVEVGPLGVRVAAVAPGTVNSELWTAAGVTTEDYEKMLETRGPEVPLGRVGEPEEIAELIAFLVSERASWITGAVFPIDGGMGANSVRK